MSVLIDKSRGALEISSDKGLVPPKMTNAEILAIASPIEGALIYDTDNQQLVLTDGVGSYTGSYWARTLTTLSPINAGDCVNIDTGCYNGRQYTSAFGTTGGINIGKSDLTPFAQYHMNEALGGLLEDVSGNLYNGTINGTPTWDTSTQKLGASALSFTGGGQYILIDSVAASTFDFEFTDSFSFDLWVKVDAAAGTSRVLISKGTTSAGYKLSILANGNPEIELNANGVTRKLLKEGVFNFESSLGVWHHLVVTYDGSGTVGGLKLYVDNTLLSIANSTETYTPGDTLITTEYFQISGVNGNNLIATNITLDELVVYNIELNTSEIASRYNSGVGDESVGLSNNIFKLRNDYTNNLVELGFGLNGDTVLELEKTGNINIVNGDVYLTDITNSPSIIIGPNDSEPPYAHFHLDESNSGLIFDATGSGRTGVMYGGTIETSTQKLGSGCLSFAAGEYILFENDPATEFEFEFNDSFSFEMWVRVDAVSASTRTLISKGNTTDGYKLSILANGNPELRLNSSTSTDATAAECNYNFESSLGVWHHLVATYDGTLDVGGIKIYVDGTELTLASGEMGADMGAGDTLVHGNYFEISGADEGSDTADDILIDELVIYSKELTTDEISARYNSGSGTEDIDYYENIFSVTNDLSNDKITMGFTQNPNNIEVRKDGTLAIENGSIEISNFVPSTTTNNLYNNNSSLYWGSTNLLGPGTRSVVTRSSGPYTALIDYDVLVTCSTVDITINLPTAVGNRGKTVLVSKRDATGFNVIVDADGAQTINGSLTHTISTQFESIEFCSDGSNWYTRN